MIGLIKQGPYFPSAEGLSFLLHRLKGNALFPSHQVLLAPLCFCQYAQYVSQLRKRGSERRGEEEHLPSNPFQQLTRGLGAGRSEGSRTGLRTKAVWLWIIAVTAKGFLSSVVIDTRFNSKLAVI